MFRRVAFVLLLTLLAGAPAAGQEWARKMFQQRSHDFGTVARGAKAEFEFVLTNIYLEDIHISSVRSSCGCTRPRIEKPWLKTYEKGAIVAAFNTRAFLGQRSATVTVTIDKPFFAEVQLQVKGHIRRDVVFDPGSVQLGSVEAGNSAQKHVAVNYAGRGSWKILDVRSANPHLSAEAVETRRHGGRVGYDLLVHLDRQAPVGYLKDHVVLVTNDPRARQIPLLVEGRVESGLTVSPASLFMGAVEPGKRVTKQLVVRGKKPFRIVSIECDDESFEFGPVPDGPAKPVYVVSVTFVASATPGKVSQIIRIETDLNQMTPELSAYAVVLP